MRTVAPVLLQELSQRRQPPVRLPVLVQAPQGREGGPEHRQRRERADHPRRPQQRPAQGVALALQRAGPQPQVGQPVVAQGRARPVGAVHDEVVRPEDHHRHQGGAHPEAAPDHHEGQQQQHQVEHRREQEGAVAGRHGVEQQVGDAHPDRRGVAAHVVHGLEVVGRAHHLAEVAGVPLVGLPALGREV